MARRIIIEDVTKPEGILVPAEPSGMDLQDGLLIAGVAFSEIAAIVIWWPSALILASLWCLGFAYMIERTESTAGKHGHPKP